MVSIMKNFAISDNLNYPLFKRSGKEPNNIH